VRGSPKRSPGARWPSWVGGDVGGDDLGGKAPRRLVGAAVDDGAVHDQADPFGPAEVEMGADGSLGPGPGPSRLVGHSRAGDLQLGYRKGPVEAGPAVVGGERAGHDRRHAPQQAPEVTGAEPGAGAPGPGRVFDRAQPVFEGGEADPGLGQLGLGLFVTIGTGPQRVRRVRAQPYERRPPLVVGESEVGRWRGASRPFSSAPLPNPACDFHRTGLSSDYSLNVATGCPGWMPAWHARQTTSVLRRRLAMMLIHWGS
jgi:hypothetical protein